MLRILWRLRNLGDGAAARKLEKSRGRPKTTSIGKCQDAGETRQTADRYQLLFLRQLPARRATLIGALDALPNVIPQARQDRSCQVRQRGLVGLAMFAAAKIHSAISRAVRSCSAVREERQTTTSPNQPLINPASTRHRFTSCRLSSELSNESRSG